MESESRAVFACEGDVIGDLALREILLLGLGLVSAEGDRIAPDRLWTLWNDV